MKWILIIEMCMVVFAYAADKINPDAELPAELTICDARDEKRDECFFELAQKLLIVLRNGIPSFNIPPMDPFHTENDLFEYKNGFLFGQMLVKSADSYGFSKATFKSVKTEITQLELAGEFNAIIPDLLIDGLYSGKGVFNGLKMQSKGFFNVSMTNVDVTTKFAGKFIERDGEKYFKATKVDMIPKVGDMKVFATGMFPEPALNTFVLNLANQYWRVFYEAMLPDARVNWSPILLEAADNITMKIPVRRLIAGI